MSVRGDVTVTLGGKDYRLVYDLGALAIVEDKLEIDGLVELHRRLTHGHIKTAMTYISACATRGGNELNDDVLMGLEPEDLFAAVRALNKARGDDDDDDEIPAPPTDGVSEKN